MDRMIEKSTDWNDKRRGIGTTNIRYFDKDKVKKNGELRLISINTNKEVAKVAYTV